MKKTIKLLCIFLCVYICSFSTNLFAHESRPAHLQLIDEGDGNFTVDWTRPVRSEEALNIEPLFPPHCQLSDSGMSYQLPGQLHENWRMDCGERGLPGELVSVAGLSATISDVLFRFQYADGQHFSRVLNNRNVSLIIPKESSARTVPAEYYFKLGVEHIIFGYDHLLFVFGLLLLVKGIWPLIKTVTSFTLAHSLTLVAAISGLVNVPTAPVEALIALSILFLAYEIVRDDLKSITLRFPWLVAGGFGLLHGLGFAGALSEIGLPANEIPLALLLFNLGVEAGQLLFIFVVLLATRFLLKFKIARPDYAKIACSYFIGSVAVFWVLQRVGSFY